MTALPDRPTTWAKAHAPRAVVDVGPAGGGITDTKWVVQTEGDPLVMHWSDPQIWGATGREHVRREALACRLLAGSGVCVKQDETRAGSLSRTQLR